MSEVREGLLYSEDHEWMQMLDPRTVRVGISDFAQCQLGDVVFIELPEVGAAIHAGQNIGTIESVKTVSDLIAPVSGTVTKVNAVLIDQPELVNEQPYHLGWMVEIECTEAAQAEIANLMDSEQYQAYIDEQP
ncbi:glycine cleavage system protein GcvH [Paenibacillus xerothermodurans]|uniref:Glycine cleavage system H protein n=1 Tax=Paenibacillus xerothermodurans TaxID=1977292 RepID=A0A2W1NS24_PAEXE|nr:glycine cleavage system protein GcvH [Paenibacillus xerothermodurans]PZE21593.1 glycine cleavage system protein GcvH [Paenibacillus xerothermodurans]